MLLMMYVVLFFCVLKLVVQLQSIEECSSSSHRYRQGLLPPLAYEDALSEVSLHPFLLV